jgi:methyl-accepting chemotaxis protein
MNGVSGWWNGLGLQLKLQVLIQGFLIVILLAAQQWISLRFEHQVLSAAENRAQVIADGAINGLNTLMIIKGGEGLAISDGPTRSTFIDKLAASDKVKELRVMHSKQLDTAYGPGLPRERPVDDMDLGTLASGKPAVRLDAGGATVRAVLPFVARENFRTINCLTCHQVPEGTVLGAASVVIDVADDLDAIRKFYVAFWVGHVVLQILLFFVIRVIVGRLLSQLGGEPAYVIDIVKHIATGNLGGTIATRPGDDTSLLAAMRQMQSGLQTMIRNTVQTADTLVQAARQLATSSHQVLTASERQSDASASVAAAVEEMTVCISEIADSAADAQKHATEAGSLAKDGSGVVREVIVEMDHIANAVSSASGSITTLGEQSRQISDIVKVIKEIAEQTNLLALNAAIEAARAGEQGRGFAVVADEVRKLAERTTHSTEEIAAMIQAIQGGTNNVVEGMAQGSTRVNEGVQLVGRADDSMGKIQDGVQKVLGSVDHISSSLREQTSTSNDIAKNVESIAQMTEETSSVIKEVATAADHLEQLAGQLKESVGQFKL